MEKIRQPRRKHLFTVIFCIAAFAGFSSCAGLPGKGASKPGGYVPLSAAPLPESGFSTENIIVEKHDQRLLLSAGTVKIDYDLASGKADVYRAFPAAGGDAPVLKGFFAETEIAGRKISSAELSRSPDCVFMEEIDDVFGHGIKVSVKNSGDTVILWQNFYLYCSRGYILLETAVESPAGTETNYIAPIAAGEGDPNNEVLAFFPAEDLRFLFIPWDNDGFIRYRSDRLVGASESYGVTAVFDNVSRQGFVAGSVTHDTWKTGIRVRTGGRTSSVTDFRIFGGIATSVTRDTQPHGSVSGYQVYSPKIFFGFCADWRDGMEEYGRANGLVAPPLPWDDGPPFGWNSWSAMAFDVNHDNYVQSSDFLKKELPAYANSRGVVYINFDSHWGMTPEQYRSAIQRVKANGQRPGTYGGFYSYWDGENWDRQVEGTDGRYTYGQIVLKDKKGRPLPPIDGARPLDPTHPGTIMRAVNQIKEMTDYGFEYVKLDFMAHGAVEGVHYNKSIKTGIQAYNYGMRKFLDSIKDRIEKKDYFISLGIAPIFPSQYAHARRISCDVFGSIDSTEYLLNSLTYGWWLGGNVYAYNDPDHIAAYNSFNHREPHSFNESLSGYISRAICGLMIDSDDFRQNEARTRVKQILPNDEINAMAGAGRPFRPAEGNTGDRACDTFVCHDAQDGVTYLALFNLNGNSAKTMKVSFERIGLDPGKTWHVRNLISHGDEAPVSSGFLTVSMEPAEPKLFKLY